MPDDGSQTDETRASVRLVPDQNVMAIPYGLLRLVPPIDAGELWLRRRACPGMNATNYTCLAYHKPISRPFGPFRPASGAPGAR